MNQFDQEIKNKIDSKKYEYKPEAWKAFKRQSGMPMMSAGAKVGLISGIIAAIIGITLFYTLPKSKSNSDEQVIAQEEITDNQNMDTIVTTETTEQCILVETVDNAATPSPTTTTEHAQIQKHAQSQAPISSQTQTPAEVQTQTSNHQAEPAPRPIRYGRPLEILVDTISSNDFPDNKPRPADMLP